MFWRSKTPVSSTIFRSKWWVLLCCAVVLSLVVFRLVVAPGQIKALVKAEWGSWRSRLVKLGYPFDPAAAKAFTSLMELVDPTNNGVSWTWLVENILTPLRTSTGALVTLLENEYPIHARVFRDLAILSGDVISLLGMDAPQTYLLVLQNSAEKRPNGWFFWSFALLTIDKWRITDLSVSDSYHPGYNRPTTKLLGPERLDQFLQNVIFISSEQIKCDLPIMMAHTSRRCMKSHIQESRLDESYFLELICLKSCCLDLLNSCGNGSG